MVKSRTAAVNPQPAHLHQYILSLPENLSTEHCTFLRGKFQQFNSMSDDQLREAISTGKKTIISQRQTQQKMNFQARQNGQPLPYPDIQIPLQKLPQQVAPDQVPQQQTQIERPKQSQQHHQNPNITHQSQSSIYNNQKQFPKDTGKAQKIPTSDVTNSISPPQKVPVAQVGGKSQQGQLQDVQRPQQIQRQSGQPQQGAKPFRKDEATKISFERLRMEVQNQHQRGSVVQLDQQNLARLHQLLTDIRFYMQRANMGIFTYFATVKPVNEKLVRQLLMFRCALMDQWEDSEYKTLKAQFTVDPATVQKAMEHFKQMFACLNVSAPRRIQQPADGQQTQTSPKFVQKLPEVHPGMNKIAEVKTLNQRVKAEKPPQAPINETPPNSFHHGPSLPAAPIGVPTYHNQINGLTPDKLVLPENKLKRKYNSQPTTSKTQSPPQIKPTAPVAKIDPSFRCTHPGCEFQRKGFSTGEQLAQHIEDAHKEKEPEDGLQFALEMARLALNLDTNGQFIRVTKMERSVSAQTMKKSASAQGPVPKLDDGISMSRVTTQTSNLGLPRTPQSVGRLGDRASMMKNDVGKEPQTPDSWADCPITPSELTNLFPGNETFQGTLEFTSLTPASTLASGKSERNTPNSDTTDNVIVSNDETENWIPACFYNGLLGSHEQISMINDDILGMDWEDAFPSSTKRRKTDINGGFNPGLFTFSWSDEVVQF